MASPGAAPRLLVLLAGRFLTPQTKVCLWSPGQKAPLVFGSSELTCSVHIALRPPC